MLTSRQRENFTARLTNQGTVTGRAVSDLEQRHHHSNKRRCSKSSQSGRGTSSATIHCSSPAIAASDPRCQPFSKPAAWARPHLRLPGRHRDPMRPEQKPSSWTTTATWAATSFPPRQRHDLGGNYTNGPATSLTGAGTFALKSRHFDPGPTSSPTSTWTAGLSCGFLDQPCRQGAITRFDAQWRQSGWNQHARRRPDHERRH